MTTSLLTDRYELTMIDAALHSGRGLRPCVFEVFARRLPAGRRFGVVAGQGRLLDALSEFRFDHDDLAWLAEHRVVSSSTLAWLADYRFSGSITGYREGEVYFPGSPLLTVTGTFAEAVVLETLVLSTLNYDSAVASAAARMVAASDGRPLAEMGSRRTSEASAVAAARAAHIAGFDATSNLEAGRRWGVPTMGTAAHSFTLLHDSEEEAFRAQVETLGAGTTLLVDTFDVERGVETAVRVAGTALGAVRLDSGDLPPLVRQVRAQLDALGATETRITVTSDLTEHTIAGLRGSPVDSFGVGTSVVTGSGSPAAGLVYKLVAHQSPEGGDWTPVAKASPGKVSRGGTKRGERLRDAHGRAIAEHVIIDDTRDSVPDGGAASGGAPADEGGASIRPLTVPLVTGGEAGARWQGTEGVQLARAHCADAVAELPAEAMRLGDGDPALPTVYK
ncbi:MAG: nicotinate phosphoribosyltransferase [Microcella sp.]|uniref:nicotinate phosphoribosyltransferase n=1 Tax=Microcella sp. TaxID=1913979 RepID=UPI0033151004